MKPRVVLVSVSLNCNYLLTRYYYRLPSLGIGYMAAVLKKNGYDVHIIDRMIAEDQITALADEIVLMHPAMVGFYAVSEVFKVVMGVMRTVKEKDASIITMMGGPHVYGLPERVMENECVDLGIRGEAEESFLKLINSNFNREGFKDIPGLMYRDNGEIKINPMALIKDLDSLPFPARELYPPMESYRPSLLAYRRLPATGIITSRGCANRCIFCHSGKGHFGLRFHSARYVLDEIKHLKKGFGINELIIFDDTFLINKDRAMKICEGMIREKMDMSWSCNARARDLTRPLLEVMKRAGCWLVQIGAESGRQEILDTIKKGVTLDEIQKACRLAYDTGIQVKLYFILGHPGETVDSMNDSIRFMTGLPAHYVSINFMTPLPGTELWDTAGQYGTFDRERFECLNCLSDKPAFIPFGLTECILMRKRREAYLKFYLNPGTVMRYVGAIKTFEDAKKMFKAAAVLSGVVRDGLITEGNSEK